jgi:hypothetical protein
MEIKKKIKAFYDKLQDMFYNLTRVKVIYIIRIGGEAIPFMHVNNAYHSE